MTKLRKTEKWTFSLTLVAAIAGATLFGGFYGNRLFGSPVQSEVSKRFKEYTDLLGAVTQWAPEETGSDKFVYSSIDGMLRTLDPHTSFLEPKEYADMQDRQKGSFYGLGILVTKRNDQVTVITPLEGTPAARLGIRAGDVISEVEGYAKAAQWVYAQAVEQLPDWSAGERIESSRSTMPNTTRPATSSPSTAAAGTRMRVWGQIRMASLLRSRTDRMTRSSRSLPCSAALCWRV